jgi:hypothetical protein
MKEQSDGSLQNDESYFNKVVADFQCYVCGALFNTDEDRKQHLEKEAKGILREGTTAEEMKIARLQEELNESHSHHV